MKLITIRTQILEVVDRWKSQYREAQDDKLEILRKLESLDLEAATAKDLEEIIGNSSWAEKQKCYECNNYFETIIQVGEKPDYESCTTHLCESCVEKAFKLIKGKR